MYAHRRRDASVPVLAAGASRRRSTPLCRLRDVGRCDTARAILCAVATRASGPQPASRAASATPAPGGSIAPLNDATGTLRSRRIMWGGRAHVRTVWSMGTLVARASNPRITALYERLRAAGKVKKVALTAYMPKFLTIRNAMLKHRRPGTTRKGRAKKIYKCPLDNQDSCSARTSPRPLAAPEARRSASNALRKFA